jgi:uncharacterized membrane protein YhaH (DUF805 family)
MRAAWSAPVRLIKLSRAAPEKTGVAPAFLYSLNPTGPAGIDVLCSFPKGSYVFNISERGCNMGNLDLTYLFTSPEGRIGRQRWWIGVAILFGSWLILNALFGVDGLVPFVLSILLMLAGIMLHIKRFHDRDKSGWWVLILFVPLLGFIWAIIDLGILEGTTGANRFGPDPRA